MVGKRSDVHEFSCNTQSWQDWYVCIVEIESKLDKVICRFSDNSKHPDKCKFDFKLIRLLTVSNLFPFKNCTEMLTLCITRKLEWKVATALP